MKSDNSIIDLTSIQFIFRHPWLFIYPIVIISSIAFGSASSTTGFKYECSGVLSFEYTGGTVINKKFIEQRIELVERVLLGENIRRIIKDVWPNVDETADPAAYSSLVERLRDSRSGISIDYDKKDRRLLKIAFVDRNPEKCYKVVAATIDTIQYANRQASVRELESGMVFLKGQIDFYKKKIKAIDEEVSKLKSELKEKSVDLSDKERDLVEEMLGAMEGKNITSPALSITAQKIAKYEEISADLNLQLLEAERKKEDLERQIKKGIFTPEVMTGQNIEEDTFVKEYSRAIATKKLEAANLLSQGYRPEHPHVIRIEKEIKELESLKAKRMEELTMPSSSEVSDSMRRQQEESAKAALQNIEFQIDTLKDKIKLMDKYKKGSVSPDVQIRREDVAKLASRLTELRGEKQISSLYYTDLRKELETAEIKSRLQKEEIFNIRVVEPPKMPTNPVPFQMMSKLLMGIMMSVAAGVGLCYVVDSLDNSIKSTSALRELLQIPVLVSIDMINTPQEIKARHLQRNIAAVSLVGLAILSNLLARFGMLRLFFK
jgi:hypothetical protein